MRCVCTVSLRHTSFGQRRRLTHSVGKETCLSNHDSVIYAETAVSLDGGFADLPLVSREYTTISFRSHYTHHLL